MTLELKKKAYWLAIIVLRDYYLLFSSTINKKHVKKNIIRYEIYGIEKDCVD
jgi:hypothetical protein